MDVNCAPHIIQYFIFGFLFMLFMLDLKCLIRSQSNKFNKKKTQEKDNVELLREKLFNCLIVMEKLTFQIPVLFLSVLFRTPYCLLLY